MSVVKDYRCVCGWGGQHLTLHPRHGFGVCPRCWAAATERSPERIFKVMWNYEDRRKIDRYAPSWLPWLLVEKWRDQAEQNHDQTLERLHERGGLSPAELWCAAYGRGLRAIGKADEIDDERALPWLYRMYRGEP